MAEFDSRLTRGLVLVMRTPRWGSCGSQNTWFPPFCVAACVSVHELTYIQSLCSARKFSTWEIGLRVVGGHGMGNHR